MVKLLVNRSASAPSGFVGHAFWQTRHGAITSIAVQEARQYEDAGFHGVMIENMHDRPYLNASIGPEITSAIAVIASEVKRATALPFGIQVLAGANSSSLAVALTCGASFVRVQGFVFAHIADEGLIKASAGALLRYRRANGADHIPIFADVKKKHSAHAISADIDIAETAKTAEYFLVDVVLVDSESHRHRNPSTSRSPRSDFRRLRFLAVRLTEMGAAE